MLFSSQKPGGMADLWNSHHKILFVAWTCADTIPPE